jgi:hypothetical protein
MALFIGFGSFLMGIICFLFVIGARNSLVKD